RLDLCDQRPVVGKVLLLKAWIRGALSDVGEFADYAGQETASKRRVRYEADAELACRIPLLLGLRAIQQRIFDLHRRNGMHLVRAADRLRPGLGKAEVSH